MFLGWGQEVPEFEADLGAVSVKAAEELVGGGVRDGWVGGDAVPGSDVFVVPLEIAAWF